MLMEFKQNQKVEKKLLSLTHRRSHSKIINKTIQQIFKSNEEEIPKESKRNVEFFNGPLIKHKYSTPKAIKNVNQMPKFHKKFAKKLDFLIEKSNKISIKILNSQLIDNNFPENVQTGFFSPKIKLRHMKLKEIHQENKKINESEINMKKIIDLSEQISFPVVGLNKSINEENAGFPMPKSKRFVTISFNQMMLKNLLKEKNPKMLMNKFYYSNYISLDELNKKINIY